MTLAKNRVQVLHGVNLNMLGSRDPLFYGSFTLHELESQITGFAKDLGLEVTFSQTNHEGEFVEHIHRLPDVADAAILNPGSWTHYAYAIRDALELTGVPAVEVHISDISQRESWRHKSVFEDLDLVFGQVYGKGAEGYCEALELIAARLSKDAEGGDSA